MAGKGFWRDPVREVQRSTGLATNFTLTHNGKVVQRKGRVEVDNNFGQETDDTREEAYDPTASSIKALTLQRLPGGNAETKCCRQSILSSPG